MAEASVEIPAGLADRVRDSVALLYEAAAEGLHLALRAGAGTGVALEEVRQQRDRLARLDTLLVRLGWWSEAARQEVADVRLEAPYDLLGDALHGALIDAGERLALACGAGRRDSGRPADVRAAAMDVIALDGLLAELRG
jgi:hypothetical protein